MAIADLANAIVALCREGKNVEAINTYFSDDASSVEPVGSEEMPAETKGKAGIVGKNEWWIGAHEIHESTISGPYIGENQFAVHYNVDVTMKESGQRMQIAEMILYTVESDKVVREEFYYNMPGM